MTPASSISLRAETPPAVFGEGRTVAALRTAWPEVAADFLGLENSRNPTLFAVTVTTQRVSIGDNAWFPQARIRWIDASPYAPEPGYRPDEGMVLGRRVGRIVLDVDVDGAQALVPLDIPEPRGATEPLEQVVERMRALLALVPPVPVPPVAASTRVSTYRPPGHRLGTATRVVAVVSVALALFGLVGIAPILVGGAVPAASGLLMVAAAIGAVVALALQTLLDRRRR
ncbi:hypothetical protein HQQ81_16010 [Microbacteriaceae bacterium VKM Ac-2854]|nr:hypothetical protein [Microbacteriaceae bacterium VKM Ac-2854]